MANAESRPDGTAGDGGRVGQRICLVPAVGGPGRWAAGPVFLPREDGPAASWLLTEAALTASD